MAEQRNCPECGTEIAYAARMCRCGWGGTKRRLSAPAPDRSEFDARKRASESRWNAAPHRSSSPVVAEILKAFEGSVAFRHDGLVGMACHVDSAVERIPGCDDE